MQNFSWFLIIGFVVVVIAAVVIFKLIKADNDDIIKLPTVNFNGSMTVETAIKQRRSIRTYKNESISLAELTQVLWSAQGVTDDAKNLRSAPSAGGLYPLETYVVVGEVRGIAAGVYTYNQERHELVKKSRGDRRQELSAAALSQEWVRLAPVSLVICAQYKRTEGKYEERARQYVHIEVGAAAENVYLQATALNMGTVFVGAFEDDKVQKVLELAADIVPLCILPIGKK